MKRKKRKLKAKVIRFTHQEIKTLARTGGRFLTRQAVANHIQMAIESYKCPVCNQKFCYNTANKQIFCGETCYLSKCEKQEYIPKTCGRCV